MQRQPALGQQELGQIMGVDPSVLVTLLNPLEADGYVSRQRDPADRRRNVVALSPAGGQHLAAAAQAQRAAEDQLFSSLDPQRPANLARFTFLDQRARRLYPDWNLLAGICVAFLRTEAGRTPTTRTSRTWWASCRPAATSSAHGGAPTTSATTAAAPRPASTRSSES
jgi:DNA-binding MarR family transcriptional regulator